MASSLLEMTVEGADILRLIAAHLTECGLYEACHALRKESGVGSAGCLRAAHSNFKIWAERGEWGTILESLSTIDQSRMPASSPLLLADVHEQAILELAELGEMRLAYASLRAVEDELDKLPADVDPSGSKQKPTKTNEYVLSRKRDLEQRLAELVSLRSMKDADITLPPNFYGKDSTTKQDRRQDIGQRLADTIPVVPPSRLTSLLQQALKWQAYTGQLPKIRNHWEDDEAIPDAEGVDTRPRKRKRTAFDLVMGEVEIDPVNVGDIPIEDAIPLDPIPSKPYSIVKFGKRATAEAAIFARDVAADGANPSTTTFSLVTGSSDGLVELYDAHNRYATLRVDLPYQEKDELMGHDDESSVLALAASNDGTMLATGASNGEVKIWRISTGRCLRTIAAHKASVISCLAFSPDASHVLTGSQDSNCREFGLRTTRMLKEFHGHSSFVLSCQYVLRKGGHQLCVVTSSADGTVRLWNAKTSEALRVFQPVSMGDSLTGKGSSIVVDHRSDLTSGAGGSPAVHSVLHLHTPADSMIIVPRGLRAFLVNYNGTVLRTFEDNVSANGKVFVAATVSPTNHWLYCVTEEGVCCVFDIATGQLEKSLPSFGEESTSKSKEEERGRVEITGLIHHPHRGILAAWSNDKRQRKGCLMLWK